MQKDELLGKSETGDLLQVNLSPLFSQLAKKYNNDKSDDTRRF